MFTCLPFLFCNDGSRLFGSSSFSYQFGVILLAAAHAGESAAASQPMVTGGSASMESITRAVASHSPSSEPRGPADEILYIQDDKH